MGEVIDAKDFIRYGFDAQKAHEARVADVNAMEASKAVKKRLIAISEKMRTEGSLIGGPATNR